MIEILLLAVIVSQIIYITWLKREHRAEIKAKRDEIEKKDDALRLLKIDLILAQERRSTPPANSTAQRASRSEPVRRPVEPAVPPIVHETVIDNSGSNLIMGVAIGMALNNDSRRPAETVPTERTESVSAPDPSPASSYDSGGSSSSYDSGSSSSDSGSGGGSSD